MTSNKRSYKEPVFLFTSCSLRHAAQAGWQSALGNKKLTEEFVHQAHAEWIKELGAGRKYLFLDRYNNDIWKYIPKEKLKEMVDNFLKSVKKEVKKGKTTR